MEAMSRKPRSARNIQRHIFQRDFQLQTKNLDYGWKLTSAVIQK